MLMTMAAVLLIISVYFLCRLLIGLRIQYSVAKRRANIFILLTTGGLSTILAAVDKLF